MLIKLGIIIYVVGAIHESPVSKFAVGYKR